MNIKLQNQKKKIAVKNTIINPQSQPHTPHDQPRTALVGLYPAQQSMIDAAYTAELAKVADAPGKDAGVHLGVQVASDLLAIRAGDGSAVPAPPFVPGTNPGNF